MSPAKYFKTHVPLLTFTIISEQSFENNDNIRWDRIPQHVVSVHVLFYGAEIKFIHAFVNLSFIPIRECNASPCQVETKVVRLTTC